jgi:TolB protein
VPLPKAELDLQNVPFKILHETLCTTDGKENWELYSMNADGSNPVNLTETPSVDELYPHASPDGTRICFVADEMTDKGKVRNVYVMNMDKTGRTKIADNGRDPCWDPSGQIVAYLGGEFAEYTYQDYASKGVFFFNTKTQERSQHPNKDLFHLYNICWSPDARWFVATVHGGMGFRHADLAFEAAGNTVVDLSKFKVHGCRPDLSADGKKITWGLSDNQIGVADIDFSGKTPRVTGARALVTCEEGFEVYHTDFSPDGKYVVFSYGPKGDEMMGGRAPGWNTCVTDLAGKWVQVTEDGHHNKEPDWVPVAR